MDKRRQRTMERLLAAAISVAHRDGYKAVTGYAIAKELCLSTGVVYYYFKCADYPKITLAHARAIGDDKVLRQASVWGE